MVSARKKLSTKDFVTGILQNDRGVLARAITLIESRSSAHQTQANELLTAIMPHTGSSIRVGISGAPGVGKSTLIEALGQHIISEGHKVAVLAVDPSSSISGGSILGDKTRMEKLAANPESFIRPSPSSGTLGGVAQKTRESILLCETSGYDVIIVETVGVGQSEITVRSMVDFFLLLQIPGSGDELQGIKKGIIEIADAIFINKADGDNIARAELAKKEIESALHYLASDTNAWQPKVATCSALSGEGVPEIWQTVHDFKKETKQSGLFVDRRKQQAKAWMHDILSESLREFFLGYPGMSKMLDEMEHEVTAGKIPPGLAVQKLLRTFREQVPEDISLND